MYHPDDPLLAPSPAEVPLANAPLVRVVAQLRFPTILKIEDPSAVAPFQEAIRQNYLMLQQERIRNTPIGPGGVAATAASPVIWRFSGAAGEWRVSLSTGFLTLETVRYTSRSDLLDRLDSLLRAGSTYQSADTDWHRRPLP